MIRVGAVTVRAPSDTMRVGAVKLCQASLHSEKEQIIQGWSSLNESWSSLN